MVGFSVSHNLCYNFIYAGEKDIFRKADFSLLQLYSLKVAILLTEEQREEMIKLNASTGAHRRFKAKHGLVWLWVVSCYQRCKCMGWNVSILAYGFSNVRSIALVFSCPIACVCIELLHECARHLFIPLVNADVFGEISCSYLYAWVVLSYWSALFSFLGGTTFFCWWWVSRSGICRFLYALAAFVRKSRCD